MPGGVLSPGWVQVAGGAIEAVGTAEPPGMLRPGQPVIRGHWALPGFIDMHVHGGGGASFTEGDEEGAARAAAFHRRHGTTRVIASLVTAPADALARRASMLADL